MATIRIFTALSFVGALVVIGATTSCADDEKSVTSTTTSPTPEPTIGTTVPTQDTAVVGTSSIDAGLLEALVVSRTEVPPRLEFLRSVDGQLWATGTDGRVVRVVDGNAEELVIPGITGLLFPTVTDDAVWLAELGGSHVVRIGLGSFEADQPIEVEPPVGMIVVGPDDALWIEQSQPPAGLRPFDPTTGTVGDATILAESDEIVGTIAAFGSLWAPVYGRNEILHLDADGTTIDSVADRCRTGQPRRRRGRHLVDEPSRRHARSARSRHERCRDGRSERKRTDRAASWSRGDQS